MSGFTVLPERVFPQRVFAPDIWPNNSVAYEPVFGFEAGVNAQSVGRRIYAKTLPRPFAHSNTRSQQ